MRLVPESNNGKVQFYLNHLEPWTENAEQIGADPAMVAELAARTQAAYDALAEQRAAYQAAQTATQKAQLALDQMTTMGSAIVMHIRAKAALAGDGVYSLASIPPPENPSPIAAPGQPSNFKFELGQDGWLTLRWRCRNPRGAVGTVYRIHRQLGPDAPFEYLGTSGKKEFVDRKIPVGTTQVAYKVVAERSAVPGPAALFIVNFGSIVPGQVNPFVAMAEMRERTAA